MHEPKCNRVLRQRSRQLESSSAFTTSSKKYPRTPQHTRIRIEKPTSSSGTAAPEPPCDFCSFAFSKATGMGVIGAVFGKPSSLVMPVAFKRRYATKGKVSTQRQYHHSLRRDVRSNQDKLATSQLLCEHVGVEPGPSMVAYEVTKTSLVKIINENTDFTQ
ncbi:hypothetical protein LTS09_011531 [Friedmanniomyces endolithicus]|nr:hypothetical protein LTS09_011531 [Friedmanniomyces endolithicus]